MTVAGFIAAQRTDHGVPNTVASRALGVSTSWFYKGTTGRRRPGNDAGRRWTRR